MRGELLSETWSLLWGDFSGTPEQQDFPSRREARWFIDRKLSEGTPYALHKVVVYMLETGVKS